MRRILPVLRVEFVILAALVVGGLVGWINSRVSAAGALEYDAIGADDLGPFRSDFNANSDHIRLVLLVGPT